MTQQHEPTHGALKWKSTDYALRVYGRDFGWLTFPSDEEEPPEEWLAHVWRRGTTEETKHVSDAISKTRVQAVLDGIGELQKWEIDNPPEMLPLDPDVNWKLPLDPDPEASEGDSEPPDDEPPDVFAGATTLIAAVLLFAVLGLVAMLRGCGL